MLVWLNGRLVAAARARVPALDRGLLHGDGVYDTWRTYGGVPFMVPDHVYRLAQAARALELELPGGPLDWERRSRALVARNRLPDAAVRLTLTRGAAGTAPLPAGRARPTLLMTARPLPPDLARQQARGAAAVLLGFPRDTHPAWGHLKLVGHPSAVLGRLMAARRHAAEGLYVTPADEITEGTASNVFVVEGQALVTPPPSAGVLEGVTRAVVVDLARGAGLAVREETVRADRLLGADEVFLTASSVELLPVVRVDGRTIGEGEPGPITRALQEAYRERVAIALRVARALRGRSKPVTASRGPGRGEGRR